MITVKSCIYLLIFTVPLLFASDNTDMEPDTLIGNDSTTVSAAGADSGKTDSTVADSLLAAINAEREKKKPEKLTLPQLETVASRFVDFLEKTLVIQGTELVFSARFIVLGKAVFGHFDVMKIGDSGTIITTISTDDRSYRSDKGGRPKTLELNAGPAAGCALVKASFHEMRKEPENGLCTTPR